MAIILLGTVFSWWLAGLLIPEISEQRKFEELDLSPEVAEDLPPDIAVLSVILGSFRGLLVDFLWERAELLEKDGKFYEARQLAHWITTLQPKFERVWSHLAWNMTHNLSAATHTPEERWTWIQAGIRLLRDEAIPYNPLSILLHKDLAFSFLHKVSGQSDEFHSHYKIRFLSEWETVLGVPPESSDERLEWFRPIADASSSVTDLIRNTPSLAEKVDLLHSHRVELGSSFIAAVREHATGLHPWWPTLSAPEESALLAFSRARVLRQLYKMDPRLMLDLMREIGPFDWRHPAAHGAYWVAQGALRWQTRQKDVRIQRAREVEGERRDDVEDIFAFPNMTTAMRDLLETGFLAYDGKTGDYTMDTDPRFLEGFVQSQSVRFQRLRTIPEEFRKNFEAVLERSLWMTFLAGEERKAHQILTKLRENFPESPRYSGNAEDFIWMSLSEASRTAQDVESGVIQLFLSGYHQGLGSSRPEGKEIWQRAEMWARRLHDEFAPRMDELDSFSQLQRAALLLYLRENPRVASVQAKQRVWRNLSAKDRQEVFGDVGASLHNQARRAGLDPETSFPRPD